MITQKHIPIINLSPIEGDLFLASEITDFVELWNWKKGIKLLRFKTKLESTGGNRMLILPNLKTIVSSGWKTGLEFFDFNGELTRENNMIINIHEISKSSFFGENLVVQSEKGVFIYSYASDSIEQIFKSSYIAFLGCIPPNENLIFHDRKGNSLLTLNLQSKEIDKFQVVHAHMVYPLDYSVNYFIYCHNGTSDLVSSIILCDLQGNKKNEIHVDRPGKEAYRFASINRTEEFIWTVKWMIYEKYFLIEKREIPTFRVVAEIRTDCYRRQVSSKEENILITSDGDIVDLEKMQVVNKLDFNSGYNPAN